MRTSMLTILAAMLMFSAGPGANQPRGSALDIPAEPLGWLPVSSAAPSARLDRYADRNNEYKILVPGRIAVQSEATCNRACLNGYTDRYLAALLKHDPGVLPLSPRVRFTENSSAIRIGEAGLWKTTTAVDPAYKIYLVDELTGTAGFIGRLSENGVPVYLAMRLKVVGQAITEIETVVHRGSSNMRGNHAPVARAEFTIEATGPDRIPRQDLITISGKYFDAIQHADGNAAPFSSKCNRIENGRQMTNNPGGGPGGAARPGAVDVAGMGCAEQLSYGTFDAIKSVTHRRPWVVDERLGLVTWTAVFNVPGRITALDANGNRRSSMAPGSGPVVELFRIHNRQIQEIEAIFLPQLLPYGFGTGWDD
jgi:hypothetical protein